MGPSLENELERCFDRGKVDLPLFPASAKQVLDLCSREDTGIDQLAAVIRHDPTLAAHFLRVANSPLFAARSPIVSISQALARLGTSQIRRMTIVIACETRVFALRKRASVGRQMLEGAVASALLAQEVARLRRLNVEEAFLAGLLHDVGRPLILQLVSDLEMEKVTQWDDATITNAIDAFHERIGRQLATAWRLPPTLIDTIGSHHEVVTDDWSAAANLRAIVRLADALTVDKHKAHEPLEGAEDAVQHLNLYREDLGRLRAWRVQVRDVVRSLV